MSLSDLTREELEAEVTRLQGELNSAVLFIAMQNEDFDLLEAELNESKQPAHRV